MLVELTIRDFAIIDTCRLELRDGFVAVTGETGAGKSIIIDALVLCLGGRGGADVVRHGASTAKLEAVFQPGSLDPLAEQLVEYGVEWNAGDPLILSREITSTGRSIGRINGSTVTIGQLSTVGQFLVDIHGQSEHLSIVHAGRRLQMLDQFGGLMGQRSGFGERAAMLSAALHERDRLRDARETDDLRLDLLRFQVAEIDAAHLDQSEFSELTEERTRLANADRLAALADSALSTLRSSESDASDASANLAEAVHSITQLAQIDAGLAPTLDAATELQFALEELARSILSYRDTIESDPRRLDLVESRLDEIHKLERKYGGTIEAVLEYRDKAAAELESADNRGQLLDEAESRLDECRLAAATAARHLSEARRHAATRLIDEVSGRLIQLGLGPARFGIELDQSLDPKGLPLLSDQPNVAFTSTGIDRARFMVSFNAGEPMRPIERVASGGETARFVLALKAALAEADEVPTVIFDEIDTGVGGRSGAVVGRMLAQLAGNHQVISITHLAQVAACAGQHLTVVKDQNLLQTTISVRELHGQERRQELAEMLAGPSPGAAALTSADDLLAASANPMLSGG